MLRPQIPELAGFDAAVKQQLLQIAVRRQFRDPRFVAGQIVLCCLALAFVAALWFTVTGARIPIAFVILGLFAFFTGGIVLALLGIRRNHSFLRQSLQVTMREEGVLPTRCFSCGYPLKGMTSDRCPECGEVLRS